MVKLASLQGEGRLNPSMFIILLDVKEPTLVVKNRARTSRCYGLSSVVYHGWEGKRAHLIWSLALLCDPHHSLFLCCGKTD